MRLIIILNLFLITALKSHSQSMVEILPEKHLRVTLINPGIELELPHTPRTIISFHGGIGYGGSYPNLTIGFESGVQALIFPFLDIQYRWLYNRERRYEKGKNIDRNSGPFMNVRGLVRGKELSSTFIRTSNIDFAIGLGWGFQNYKRRLGWSFSVAPYYYFDDRGNAGFFPLIPEINIGYVLGK